MKTIGVRTVFITLGILLLPLIAMQFTNEVTWDITDFLVGGILFLVTGLSYEVVSTKAVNKTHRIGTGVTLFTSLLLIWVNLAVGLIGSENNPANLMYVGLLGVVFIGATMSRLKADTMVWVMSTAAVSQILVALIAIIAGWGQEGANWPWNLAVGNLIFALLWLGSAGLFGLAAQKQRVS